MTAIIGLDLSLAATGVANGDGEFTIKTKPADPIVRRLIDIRTELAGFVDREHAEVPGCRILFVVEDLPKHVKHGGPELGMVHGVVRTWIAENVGRSDLVLVPPASLKKYCTGKGPAAKADMRIEAYKRWNLDVRDDNQLDALVLRCMALDAYGTPRAQMPQSHRDALEKIEWPVLEAVA